MVSNPKKRKFYLQIILWPTEYTQIYNLAHYEKRLDIPALRDKNRKNFAQIVFAGPKRAQNF